MWGLQFFEIPNGAELYLSLLPMMTPQGQEFEAYAVVIDSSRFVLSFGIVPALSPSPGLPVGFTLNPYFPHRRLISLQTFTSDIKIRCELKHESAMTSVQVEAYRSWVKSLSSQLKKVFDWTLQD